MVKMAYMYMYGAESFLAGQTMFRGKCVKSQKLPTTQQRMPSAHRCAVSALRSGKLGGQGMGLVSRQAGADASPAGTSGCEHCSKFDLLSGGTGGQKMGKSTSKQMLPQAQRVVRQQGHHPPASPLPPTLLQPQAALKAHPGSPQQHFYISTTDMEASTLLETRSYYRQLSKFAPAAWR